MIIIPKLLQNKMLTEICANPSIILGFATPACCNWFLLVSLSRSESQLTLSVSLTGIEIKCPKNDVTRHELRDTGRRGSSRCCCCPEGVFQWAGPVSEQWGGVTQPGLLLCSVVGAAREVKVAEPETETPLLSDNSLCYDAGDKVRISHWGRPLSSRSTTLCCCAKKTANSDGMLACLTDLLGFATEAWYPHRLKSAISHETEDAEPNWPSENALGGGFRKQKVPVGN